VAGGERVRRKEREKTILTVYGESCGENRTTFTLLREQQKNPEIC
jgi:hypothetical protein